MIATTEELAARCRADGELLLAARHWTGGLRLDVDGNATGFTVADGEITAGVPAEGGDGVIALSGPTELWDALLAPVPPRLLNAVGPALAAGLTLDADHVVWWQYLPAVDRAVELMREPAPAGTRAEPAPAKPAGHHDSPVGRYVHVDIDGSTYRLFYEEAGDGIPLLCQHTAGANGLQYRHLFEVPEITDHFRLIAYDLPFHGRSVPPSDQRWWETEYKLDGSFLRQVPVQLAAALDLDRPAFMGCSVGGLLALDLALHHPDAFRAVISLEGALHIGGSWDGLAGMWHPQVSNFSKARLMEGLCAPTSPEPYVKEVSQVYSAGWPPAFRGDLWYYVVDYDIRDRAAEIDTDRVGVHILSGEYDYSGTVEAGREAHEAIAGSTHVEMANIGHFPMQEHPELFVEYLLPVLDEVRKA